MKVHKKIGGTNRLIEMFEKVNKIKINEDFKFPDDEEELTPQDITGDNAEEEEEETIQSDSPLSDNPIIEPEVTDDTNMGTEEPMDDMPPEDSTVLPGMSADGEEPIRADEPVGMFGTEPPEESGVEIELGTPCDTLEGGVGDEAEVAQFNSEQVAIGIRTEMEHTADPKIALEIALDHLTELPDYYTRLDAPEMEAGMDVPQEQDGGSEEEAIVFGKNDAWVDSYKPVGVGDDVADVDVEASEEDNEDNLEIR